ncbi:TRAP transporter large permease [Antarctobacter sp.]|uniref:TRAP transporter large permease n=1 Tax=Antarctobacter sp. TaxID=1872577 RepID=UPI003A8E4A2B
MTDPQIGAMAIGVLFLLIALRVPIAVALTGVPFFGIWYLINFKAAVGALKVIPYSFAANWLLSSVPMFLLMGYLAYHTGITRGLFNAARIWLARLPGGLAIASVMGASGFAAVTGSSVACAAAMGRIAVPEMLKNRYDAGLATGTVAAAGTIGALIPPSILFIIYGIIAVVPIGDLFLGGAIAGLLTALSYVAVILIRAKLTPGLVPTLDETYTARQRMAVLLEISPILLLALLVFGGLFGGFFTATEAGAVGAAICAVIAFFKGGLTWRAIKASVSETITTTAAIFVIAIGANLLGRFVAISQADVWISDLVGLFASNFVLLMGMIVLLYLVLGMFLDPLGAMLLTMPILLPVMRDQGLDLLWFGVILAKLLEIGMITPPVGLNVFVLKSVVGDAVPIGTIFRGVAYFLLADLMIVILLIAFPEIVLYLPRVFDQ